MYLSRMDSNIPNFSPQRKNPPKPKQKTKTKPHPKLKPSGQVPITQKNKFIS
jgi:hypothetical protein